MLSYCKPGDPLQNAMHLFLSPGMFPWTSRGIRLKKFRGSYDANIHTDSAYG